MFLPHKLTSDEQLSGLILSTLQKCVLENRLAELSYQIANYPAKRSDPDYFDKLNLQKGQLAEVRIMLETSAQAEESLNTAKE